MPAFLPSSRITFSFPSSRLFVSLRAEKPGLPFSLSLPSPLSFLCSSSWWLVRHPSVLRPSVRRLCGVSGSAAAVAAFSQPSSTSSTSSSSLLG